MADSITVEVVCALPERQELLILDVPEGTTALQAIRLSKILKQFPEVELDSARVGVFGKLCEPGRVLEAGDRVEIYRPLKIDPKEGRRQRAKGKDL